MTQEEIDKEPWIGEQRAQVTALLRRAEKAEALLKRINKWCEPAGTGAPDGDELNMAAEIYRFTKEFR